MTRKRDGNDILQTGGWSRRRFIGAGALMASGWGIRGGALEASEPPGPPRALQKRGAAELAPASGIRNSALRDNIYTRLLGVEPVIGGAGPLSSYGNTRMSPEVLEAMAEAADFLVDIDELNRAAGRRIAGIMGAEAAMVTASATGAMLLGAAACLAGTDPEKVDALPHPTWPRRECLMQRAHRFLYDRAYRAAGVTIVELDTGEELANAVSERTAMIAGLGAMERVDRPGVLKATDLVAIGRRTGVPVLIDAAGELPPASNLTHFTGLGVDLVAFSGGKALGGPSSTGILAGREDLIEAAMLNTFPNQNVGRGMKLNKEEIVGMVVALERYVELDHDALFAEWQRKSEYIVEQLQGIPGVTAELGTGSGGFAVARVDWDRTRFPMEPPEVGQRLREGRPRVVAWTFLGARDLRVSPLELADGDEVLVADRIRELFLSFDG